MGLGFGARYLDRAAYLEDADALFCLGDMHFHGSDGCRPQFASKPTLVVCLQALLRVVLQQTAPVLQHAWRPKQTGWQRRSALVPEFGRCLSACLPDIYRLQCATAMTNRYEQDLALAFSEYSKAADLGSVDALLCVGAML